MPAEPALTNEEATAIADYLTAAGQKDSSGNDYTQATVQADYLSSDGNKKKRIIRLLALAILAA